MARHTILARLGAISDQNLFSLLLFPQVTFATGSIVISTGDALPQTTSKSLGILSSFRCPQAPGEPCLEMTLRDRVGSPFLSPLLFPLNLNSPFLSVLVDYLTAKAITPTDCFKSCAGKLDTGEFKFTGPSMTPNITSQSNTCLNCATTVFADLTFDYTKAIPKNDLPGLIRSSSSSSALVSHHF